MSDASDAPDSPVADATDPSRYDGPDRYINVAEDFLDVELTAVQRRILRAVGEHKRVHVQSGNGVGKSFTSAVLSLTYLLRHPDSIVVATSGSYSVLSDVLWKPLRAMFHRTSLPGRTLESPPRIEITDEWFFKAISPRHPSNIEGRHASGGVLSVIEEVDKPDITAEHIDSAESLLTSGEKGRLLCVSNPPKDPGNVAAQLRESDRWHTVEFSSFESHNVLVDAGEIDAEPIPGLVDLQTVKDDWERWNNELWPGLETARTAHRRRDDLDDRWYIRRGGVSPPANSAAHRPFDIEDVEAAWNRSGSRQSSTPEAAGLDVARSGDRTVLAGVHGDEIRFHYNERGANHTDQLDRLRPILDDFGSFTGAIDAVGEGSGLADQLCQSYRGLNRFKAGSEAHTSDEYRDKWAEGLALLGQFLADGGSFDDRDLREELLTAARTIEFDERHLSSRGRDGATVLEATSKSAIKERLGRSPDALDAALMAVWAAEVDIQTRERPDHHGIRSL